MSFSIFIESIVIVLLLSLAFVLGGYISFRLLSLQHRKQFDVFKNDFMTIDQLKLKLKDVLSEQTRVQKNNMEILEMCDNLFTDVLSELAKEASEINKKLIVESSEAYFSKKKDFIK